MAHCDAPQSLNPLNPGFCFRAPDLTASIVNLDTVVARGHSVTVNFRITNVGDAPISQNWYDRVWLSPTSTFDSKTATDIGYFWNSDAFTQPLPAAPGPGNSYQETQNANIPTSQAVGTYYIFVEADTFGWVVESNKANNLSPAGAITVIAPDIAMTSATIISPSATDIEWGQNIDVSFSVANKTAARLDGYWYDTVVASKDNKLDASDWTLNYVVYETLSPHGSYTHNAQVKIDGPWALPAGPGFLLFVANNVDWSSPDADRSDKPHLHPDHIARCRSCGLRLGPG